MIQIIPISQFSSKEVIAALPAPLLPFTAGVSYELLQLMTLQYTATNRLESLPLSEEGLFVVLKKAQIIGYGSVIISPDAPPTAGIGLLNHCFIIPSERQQGYGTQLFQYLKQYAALHCGLLQVNKNCPLRNRMEREYIDLTVLL